MEIRTKCYSRNGKTRKCFDHAIHQGMVDLESIFDHVIQGMVAQLQSDLRLDLKFAYCLFSNSLELFQESSRINEFIKF